MMVDDHGGATADALESEREQLSRNLVTRVFVLLRTAYQHKHDNDALIAPLKNIQDTVDGLLQLVDQDRLSLRILRGTFFVNTALVRLDQESYTNAEFLRVLSRELDIGDYEFHRGCDEAEFRAMMAAVINTVRDPSVPLRRDFPHIHLTRLSGSEIEATQEGGGSDQTLRVYVAATVNTARAMERWRAGRRPALAGFKRTVQRLITLVDRDPALLLGMQRVADLQQHFASHLVNTAVVVLTMARRLGLGRDHTVALGMAALTHDVGLIDLLGDPHGARSAAAASPDLPHANARRLQDFGGRGPGMVSRLVIAFESRGHVPPARCYRFGAVPSAVSRVIEVADAYVHLTSVTPDAAAWSPAEALAHLLANPSGRFEDWALRLLAESIGRVPVGSVVMLDSGERAVVFDRPAPGSPVTRPRVRLLDRSTQSRGEIVDLMDKGPDGRFLRSLAMILPSTETDLNVSHFFLD